MNQNRRKQRPQNHPGILFVVPQPVGIARLGEDNFSRRHGAMIAWWRSIRAWELFKAGTLSQATDADNLSSFVPGSARGPRAGDRVLAITNFCRACALQWMPRLKKDCFRATPKPAREPRALPGCTRILYLSFGAERSGVEESLERLQFRPFIRAWWNKYCCAYPPCSPKYVSENWRSRCAVILFRREK